MKLKSQTVSHLQPIEISLGQVEDSCRAGAATSQPEASQASRKLGVAYSGANHVFRNETRLLVYSIHRKGVDSTHDVQKVEKFGSTTVTKEERLFRIGKPWADADSSTVCFNTTSRSVTQTIHK